MSKTVKEMTEQELFDHVTKGAAKITQLRNEAADLESTMDEARSRLALLLGITVTAEAPAKSKAKKGKAGTRQRMTKDEAAKLPGEVLAAIQSGKAKMADIKATVPYAPTSAISKVIAALLKEGKVTKDGEKAATVYAPGKGKAKK